MMQVEANRWLLQAPDEPLRERNDMKNNSKGIIKKLAFSRG
jgi:hypothetical protein